MMINKDFDYDHYYYFYFIIFILYNYLNLGITIKLCHFRMTYQDIQWKYSVSNNKSKHMINYNPLIIKCKEVTTNDCIENKDNAG